MVRMAVPSVGALLALGLWVYCIFDVIATEEMLIRNLPKTVWLLIVLFVPTVGALAWLLLGRPLYAGFRPGDTSPRRPSRPVRGPDDDPGWRPPPRDEDGDGSADGKPFPFSW
jgi:hypothetical protein